MTLKDRIHAIRRREQAKLELEKFTLLVEKFTTLVGTKGTGKTSSGIMLASKLRTLTDREVIAVGTLIGFTDEFGPHRFMNSADFICQMRGISANAEEIADLELDADETELHLLNHRGCDNPQHNVEMVQLANGQWKDREKVSEKALENIQDQGKPCWTASNGVVLYRSIVLIDEGNEFMGGEYASNPLVRLFRTFVQEMRHFRVTLIAMMPYREDLAPKIRPQVDTWGQCQTFKGLGYTRISFMDGTIREKFQIKYPSQKYWDMYTSFNLLGIRANHLAIADKYM